MRRSTFVFLLALSLLGPGLGLGPGSLGAQPADRFHPTQLEGMLLFVESVEGLRIARCADLECLSASDDAPLERQYCDLEAFPEGCVRRWRDQSPYRPRAGGPRGPWPSGRDFGQAGLDKPGYVADCVAGHPCVRGGKSVGRDRTLELSAAQAIGPLPGAFSLFLVARPIAQDDDFFYFGHGGVELSHRVVDDSLRLRLGPRPPVELTEPGSVPVGEWHLIELHRDARGEVRALVDGWDRTLGRPRVPGDFHFRALLSVSGGRGFYGDVAALAILEGRMEERDDQRVRRYFADLYRLEVGDGSPLPERDEVDLDHRLALAWSFDEITDCRVAGGVVQGGELPAGRLVGCPSAGPTPVVGLRARALRFDGVDDTVRAESSSIDLDQPFRVSAAAWIRVEKGGSADGWRSLIDKRDALEDGWDLYLSPEGRAFLRVNDAFLEGAALVTDGKWHHVAGVYDRERLRLYVDGRLDRSLALDRPESLDTRAPVMVGLGHDGRGNAYAGDLDEVRVYGRALTAPEVEALAARR